MTGSPIASTAADMKSPRKIADYLAQRPVSIALLFTTAVIFFLAVTALSHVFQAQQTALGDRWFSRGVADLNARRFDSAVLDLRTALRYSRDDYTYQLDLAQALMGQGKLDEAHAYLVNLFDRQPENGFVNLELARISAQKGETDQALRYYHNAVYAIWTDNQDASRRYARLELIEYLLKINSKTQAQAELIALAANLSHDADQQLQLGNLFLRAQDYEHALAAFRLVLRSSPHNHEALAGAGLAAFRLAQYPLAERYLQAAVAANPQDSQSAAQLKNTEDVLLLDPFRRGISATQRAHIVIEDFNLAGERLKSCSGSSSGASASGQPTLADEWTKMKSRLTETALRRDSDLVESAMELVFNIERQTGITCGSPTGSDMALLLIAHLHEGS
jgi:tetratricopeptide (TPR) repeat protein